jgi:hypothetical protein
MTNPGQRALRVLINDRKDLIVCINKRVADTSGKAKKGGDQGIKGGQQANEAAGEPAGDDRAEKPKEGGGDGVDKAE